jgi:hypothetical protein
MLYSTDPHTFRTSADRQHHIESRLVVVSTTYLTAERFQTRNMNMSHGRPGLTAYSERPIGPEICAVFQVMGGPAVPGRE